MYCSQCGTEAEENARFCAKCGRDLSGSTERPHVPNHLVWAILATICCCPPTGIVSIVYAAQVDGLVAAGDFARAGQASQNAKTWAWVSFGPGTFVGILYTAAFAINLNNAAPAVLP